MAEFLDAGVASFITSEAIGAHIRVKLESAGTVAIAGLAEKEIGVTREGVASGKPVGVILTSKQGTVKMTAIEALAIAAPVYTETAGKVQDTAQATSFLVGINIGPAATADGDIIQVLRNSHGDTAAT